MLQPFTDVSTGVAVPICVPYTPAQWFAWRDLRLQGAHRARKLVPLPNGIEPEPSNIDPYDADINVEQAPLFITRGALHDTVGWEAQAERTGRQNVHPEKEEAQKGLTMHAATEEQWNAPWMFDETLGAGPASAKVPLEGVSEEKVAQMTDWQLFQYHTRAFLLRNAYVPLLCRAVNVMLLTSTLAIGIVLRRKLRAVGEEAAVGVSPLLAIIFSPPSMAHAILQIWFEYFSLPIGLWKLSSKLWYTVLELVFVCLWSAELALAMDNYFTSTIVCTASNSPFYFIREGARTRLEHQGDKDTVCNLQVALICLTFVSVIVYLMVFMISLLRIFYRIRT